MILGAAELDGHGRLSIANEPDIRLFEHEISGIGGEPESMRAGPVEAHRGLAGEVPAAGEPQRRLDDPLVRDRHDARSRPGGAPGPVDDARLHLARTLLPPAAGNPAPAPRCGQRRAHRRPRPKRASRLPRRPSPSPRDAGRAQGFAVGEARRSRPRAPADSSAPGTSRTAPEAASRPAPGARDRTGGCRSGPGCGPPRSTPSPRGGSSPRRITSGAPPPLRRSTGREHSRPRRFHASARTRARPACPDAARAARSDRACATAPANAGTSPSGASHPPAPWTTTAPTPRVRPATTGTPSACASSIAMPIGSPSAGHTKRSQALTIPCSAGGGPRPEEGDAPGRFQLRECGLHLASGGTAAHHEQAPRQVHRAFERTGQQLERIRLAPAAHHRDAHQEGVRRVGGQKAGRYGRGAARDSRAERTHRCRGTA